MIGIPTRTDLNGGMRMRELKTVLKIIGIEHGYGNIKTANTIIPMGINACKKQADL